MLSIPASSSPSSLENATTDDAIADKKIRPASCAARTSGAEHAINLYKPFFARGTHTRRVLGIGSCSRRSNAVGLAGSASGALVGEGYVFAAYVSNRVRPTRR